MTRAPSDTCWRLGAIERRVRAIVLHWLAAVAAIDEARETAGLDERELADLDQAVQRAREEGR